MLNIITGRTGSGKTRYIRKLAADTARNEKGKSVIIVPEQFSFETERGMLEILGNEKINNVEILSFSHLAERLLSEYSKMKGKMIDQGTRAVLMSIAIETLEDKLTVFSRYRRHPALISELLEFYREMKKCNIDGKTLFELSKKVKKTSFSKKLAEISLVFDCYEAMVANGYCDDCTYLDKLYELLPETDYFKGKTVFLDAFLWFSKQERNLMECILKQCDDMYITFCCDTSKNCERYELFYNSAQEIKNIKSAAKRAGVKIAPEKVLYVNEQYKSEPLNILEKNIFNAGKVVQTDAEKAVTVTPCLTQNDECDLVASEIKRLVRTEGYRYRDIAVIERVSGQYKNGLLSSFRKYGIDCFDDNRQPVSTQPIMTFMLALFDILTEGFATDSVLRLLKTGLYGFTVEEIALIEDYCLMWRITASQWKNKWRENPEGFGVEFTDESEKLLEKINSLRERIVAPALSLKSKTESSDGETVSKEIFLFLRKTHIDENLKSLANELEKDNEKELSAEQGRIWKILTDILDNLYFAIGKNTVSLKRYKELFEIIVATKDMGKIPNGIDEVTVGSADRIRAFSPKAVFIVGANAGVFPTESGGGVLLSDFERCELMENGAEIVSNLEYNSVNERFIAYRAMTLATDKLYISYSSLDSESKSLIPSELVSEVKRIFKNYNKIDFENRINRIESRKSAFSAMAYESQKGTVLGKTLYKYFSDNEKMKSELLMIDKIKKRSFEIKDKKTATELFGESMYISASKTEKFYKCPFEYFCEYGIKARPRREAEMDSAQTGTLIHYTLEEFLLENPKDKCVKLSKNDVQEKVERIIDGYVVDRLGGYEQKSVSFLRSINLIKKSAFRVVSCLIDEFSHCKFTPVDFELSINNDGDIKPYLIKLENGNTVKIIGNIDRVDLYKTEENSFIRIVDYKTGGKDFHLYEVFAGLNMQMLIYLFAIWQNGGERYGNVIPAGILYFQAKSPKMTRSKVTRYDTAEKINKEMKKSLKMSGMVLNSVEVINAMEEGGASVYIPASIDANSNAGGSVISYDSFKALKERVDETVRKMAYSLQNGEVDAYPVEKVCDYCKYHDVCRIDEDSPRRKIEKTSFKDSLEMLRGDSDE